MFENTLLPSILTMIGDDRRASIVSVFLSFIACLLVFISILVFIYVTQKERILRRYQLATVIVFVLIELVFLIGVVSCFRIPSKSTYGQILAVLLIIISFFALMALIFFLLEDILKERIKPMPESMLPSKSHTMQEIRTISRHNSPITPPSPPLPLIPEAEPPVVPIPTPPVLTPVPRIPTPPMIPSSLPSSPIPAPASVPSTPPLVPTSPPKSPSSSPLPRPPSAPVTETVSSSLSPVPPAATESQTSPPPPPPTSSPVLPIETISKLVEPIKTPSPLPSFPPSSGYLMSFEKIRQDLLAAIEERTIPALESAIQQVKDHDVIQQLKYECERALELLNRLMKIETMKIKVLRLNQSTIAELHSYIKPPDEVSTVMRATFLLLGHSEKEIQDWQQIQTLLGRFGKESVRRRCYELNPLAIPVDKAREAKDILRNYDLIRVSEISVGLSAFYCWASAMIDEREKLLESQRRIYR